LFDSTVANSPHHRLGDIMNDARFLEIERLIEDAGRCLDPVTGTFEPVDEEEEDTDTDLDLPSFLMTLGITTEECAWYVQRKLHEYDEASRNA
jgi:hypothetical protein